MAENGAFTGDNIQHLHSMSYRAVIHDLSTGRFLMHCNVDGRNLHDAEGAAIAKAVLATKGHPCEMDVRHLHQCAERTVHVPDVHYLAA